MRDGTLNGEIVGDLFSAIEDMREAIKNGEVKIEFTSAQFNIMLGLLSYFTHEFAKVNGFYYTEPVNPNNNDALDNLLYIEEYLKIQQKIYQEG